MSPNGSDTANPAAAKARRNRSRIVPAVPLALSRAPPSARPITPEHTEHTATENEPVTQHAVEPPETAHNEVEDAPDAPLTPDSKASGGNYRLGEKTPASSVADIRDELEEVSDTRDVEAVERETDPDDTAHDPIVASVAMGVNGHQSAPSSPAQQPPHSHTSDEVATGTTEHDRSEPAFQSSQKHAPLHRPQPSLEGIVFGAAQASPVIPSTPQDPEPDVLLLRQPLQPNAPGFAPSQFAAPFYPGHSHHPSDPAAPWLQPSYSMPPPDALFGHITPSFPSSVEYQPPLPSQVSQHGTPIAASDVQTPRSHSQSPTKSQFSGTKHSSDYDEEGRKPLFQNGAVQVIDPKLGTSPFELAAYLSAQFGNPEFADYILQIHSERSLLLSMPVHGIVVARSRTIYSAIQRQAPAYRSKDSRTLLDVSSKDKLVSPEALTEAVKILYGAPLLAVDNFLYGLRHVNFDGEGGPTYHEARKRTAQAISYAAAGNVLQLHHMQSRGLEIVRALLRWDTFDLVLQSGLEGVIPHSQEAHLPVQNGGASSRSPAVDRSPYAPAFIHDALDFVAYNFPADFNLYTIAPELAQNPRLPTLVEYPTSRHNPRLSRIRFGDVPTEEPGFASRILSSLLLSVHSNVLQQIFNHPALANRVGWTRIANIMRSVVDERENRREKVRKSYPRTSSGGQVPKSLLENLNWEERLEQSSEYPSGYKISETRLTD
ncbi:hypothetical protein BDV96DRAFT_646008 [Lophiotrema nucula]|uniref:Uncharacterized protein n=1 Tax=Lophiotrema nucula TaxID=690887 RepID=A0A6A5ZBQ4_9PLEO|nr:hypothetical protein BDV96DRAFT_646008 [Lophiotrema nucula]